MAETRPLKPWQFQPGNQANPGGQPKEVAQGLAAIRSQAHNAAIRLAELMRSKNETVALAATRELLDRVYGKPKVSVDVQKTDMGALHLAALQAILERAREDQAKTIEGTAHTESPSAIDDIEGLV